MSKITFKTFITELLLQTSIFITLTLLFYYMKIGRNPFTVSFFTGLLETSPVMLFGIIYCVLFYYLFFKQHLIHKKPGKSLIALIALIAGFYLIDTIVANVITYTRVE